MISMGELAFFIAGGVLGFVGAAILVAAGRADQEIGQ